MVKGERQMTTSLEQDIRQALDTVKDPEIDAVSICSYDDAHADQVVAAFEEAEAQGLASIQLDGYFIDYPIVDQARRTLGQWKDIQNR